MLQVLKNYDKSFAEGMLARTSFYLDDAAMYRTFKPIENEEMIRSDIIKEICKELNIPSVSDNKQSIINFIDDELEKSTKFDDKTEKEILSRLSYRGELPTDLYTVKMDSNIDKDFNINYEEVEKFIVETVKKPDIIHNFGVNYCTSLFAKYYKGNYEYNNFFILVIGKRDGLVFRVNCVWRLYNDILQGNNFNDALELLKYFVEKFGIEVDFQGKTSKFFVDVIAKTEREFQVNVKEDNLKKSKKGSLHFVTCHFLSPAYDNNNNLSIFFAIDIEKYNNYISKHLKIKK